MARQPRNEVEAGIHHVYARGNNRQRIFRDARDFELYVELLEDVVRRFRWRCLSYCLMPNHVHLLVETVEPNLGIGMHRLHTLYARSFNRRRRRTGHLFENRYGSVPVTSDPQLVTTAAYIAANPVKARLVDRPEDWDWSSHAGTVAGRPPDWLAVPRLVELFAAWGGDGRARYRGVVGDRLRGRLVVAPAYFGGSDSA